MDYFDLKLGENSCHFFLALGSCASLVYVTPVKDQTAPSGQAAFQEMAADRKIKPKKVVCDLAFTEETWQRFWNAQDIEPLPTRSRTPSSNRAERAVQIMKRTSYTQWMSARVDPETASVTLRGLCAKANMARNSQLRLAGKTPYEMAFEVRPQPLFDADAASPSELVPD